MSNPVPNPPQIRTTAPVVEVAWFSALCSDDYEFLGVPDGALRSSICETHALRGNRNPSIHTLGVSPSRRVRFIRTIRPSRLKTCKLNEIQKRDIPNPKTPLTTLPRK